MQKRRTFDCTDCSNFAHNLSRPKQPICIRPVSMTEHKARKGKPPILEKIVKWNECTWFSKSKNAKLFEERKKK